MSARGSRSWPSRSSRSCSRWGSASVWCWPIASTVRVAPSSAPCTGWVCSTWWRCAPITASGCCPGSASARPVGAPFVRVFTDGSTEQRFLRETVYGTRRSVRYYQITTDPLTLPPESTWDLMTNLPGTIEQTVGNTLGLRTWIEYGFKHAKDDLGWADYRMTDAASIERWWELVMSAYTLVSLQTPDLAALGHVASPPPPRVPEAPAPVAPLEAHPALDTRNRWGQHLNNLRLLFQPYTASCLLLPWLHLFPFPHVQAVQTGFAALGSLVNTFRLALPT